MADWNSPEYSEASGREDMRGKPVSAELPTLDTWRKFPATNIRENAILLLREVGNVDEKWIRGNYPNLEPEWAKAIAKELLRQFQDGGQRATIHLFLRLPSNDRGCTLYEEPGGGEKCGPVMSRWAAEDQDVRVDVRSVDDILTALNEKKHVAITLLPSKAQEWIDLALALGARTQVHDCTENGDIGLVYEHLRKEGVEIPIVTVRAILAADNEYQRRLARPPALEARRLCRRWMREQRELAGRISAQN